MRKDEMNGGYEPNPAGIIQAVVIALVIGGIAFGALRIVQAGHVGIVTRFGAVKRVADPGIVLKIPFAERVVKMETRTQKEEVEANAASKDLQEVHSTLALNYHLDGKYATDVYQNVGTEYRERIVDPSLQEAFKATTAQFTAEELITKREEVKKVAREHLKERLEPSHVIVDDLNIVNFQFSKEFDKAIEEKQVANQNVQREIQNLERIKVEAQQAKTQAQGQAEAQRALRENGALSPEYLEYQALQKWNGILPNVVGGAVPFINVTEWVNLQQN